MTPAQKQARYEAHRRAWAEAIGRPVEMAGRSVLGDSGKRAPQVHFKPELKIDSGAM